MEKSKKNKIICPTCKGNGYIRVPYRLAKEEVTAQCGVCDSEGEIDASQADDIIVEISGAFHHVFFLNLSKIVISKSWAIKKADPDANAIRISAAHNDKITPIKNPA